jgi:hypothetical protein
VRHHRLFKDEERRESLVPTAQPRSSAELYLKEDGTKRGAAGSAAVTRVCMKPVSKRGGGDRRKRENQIHRANQAETETGNYT